MAKSFKRAPGTVRSELVLRGTVTVDRGSIVGWEKGTSIAGHIGFVTDPWHGRSGHTVEGNTSSGQKGSQADGDGVYVRTRSVEPLNYFRITWFTPVKYENRK